MKKKYRENKIADRSWGEPQSATTASPRKRTTTTTPSMTTPTTSTTPTTTGDGNSTESSKSTESSNATKSDPEGEKEANTQAFVSHCDEKSKIK